MRKLILAVLAFMLLPVFASGQVVAPGNPGSVQVKCQMDPQPGEGGNIPPCQSKIPWYYQGLTTTTACASVFATPASGNGTHPVGDSDPYYNTRLFAVMSYPTSSPAGTIQPYICDYDRSTNAQIAAGEVNGGTSICYGATPHEEPGVFEIGGGYVLVESCGADTGVPNFGNNFWGDSNFRGTGTSANGTPVEIGNCVGTTDCANYGAGAMDITSHSNAFYLPTGRFTEPDGGYFNGVLLLCGQYASPNNSSGVGGLVSGTEGCTTIRQAATPGQFTVDTVCTVGGSVVSFNFTTTNIGNNACGGAWQLFFNVHSDWMGTIDLTGNTSTSTTLTISFPTNGAWTTKSCTYTTGVGVASNDIVGLANAINNGTLGGTGCSSVNTYYHAYPVEADCARLTPANQGVTCKVNSTLSVGVAAGTSVAVTLASTPSTSPVVNDKVNFDYWDTGVQETATITSVTDSTHFTVNSLAHAHSSGSPVTIVNSMMLTAKNANPPTMGLPTVTGCASCTTGTGGYVDLRGINSGVTSHFSYGAFRSVYDSTGNHFFCGISDVQEGDTYLYSPANAYASYFVVRCSRGPDVTHTGTLGTFGNWDWGDASIVNPNGDDGFFNTINPGWTSAFVVGTTPANGREGFLAGPFMSCTNTANGPCQSYVDASGSKTNVYGVVQPCVGTACTPPSGWNDFQTNVDQATQAQNAADSANNNGWPIASNYDLVIDNNHNVGIAYICEDATKNATEICYVTQSSSTLQTINAAFVDDTNNATGVNNAYVPNIGVVRAPSGHLVILVASQELSFISGCSHQPCLIQYVSTNNGVSWTKTVLTTPTWGNTTAAQVQTCSENSDPKGYHIYALCFPYGVLGVPYYTYDLYTGNL